MYAQASKEKKRKTIHYLLIFLLLAAVASPLFFGRSLIPSVKFAPDIKVTIRAYEKLVIPEVKVLIKNNGVPDIIIKEVIIYLKDETGSDIAVVRYNSTIFIPGGGSKEVTCLADIMSQPQGEVSISKVYYLMDIGGVLIEYEEAVKGE